MKGIDHRDGVSGPEDTTGTADPRRTSILIVEDDPVMSSLISRKLQQHGFPTSVVTTALSAIDAIRARHFELVLLDLHLPDLPGMEVARIIRDESSSRFIVISGYLDVPTAVEAMRLGALEVVQKPVSLDDLLTTIKSGWGASRAGSRPKLSDTKDPALSDPEHPRSAAQRWAMHVLRSGRSHDDFKTLQQWSEFIGVSFSSLAESCRLLDIQPVDARDFARAMRALIRCRTYQCEPGALLDISDRRTLRQFTERAGPFFTLEGAATLDEFVRSQHFIPPENAGIKVLRESLSDFGGLPQEPESR